MKKVVATAALALGLLTMAPAAHAQYPPTGPTVGGSGQSRGSALPRTGADHTDDYVRVAAASIGAGSLLVLAKRRRETA
jgi:LPXTG-motif cell wall-anchored protein